MGLEIEIPLTQGKVALIDVDDLHLLVPFVWHADRRIDGRFYAMRRTGPRSGKHSIYMHRVIMAAPDGTDVDHINGNGLDNRRANLRLATCSENCSNRTRLDSRNTSGITGVSWHKAACKWQVYVNHKGWRHSIGLFVTLSEAEAARDKAAKELHGAFASPGRPSK